MFPTIETSAPKGPPVSVAALVEVQDSSKPSKITKVAKDAQDEEDCRAFGRRLLASMDKCNVSQSDLSRFMGVSRSAVSLWVKGETYPVISHIKRIANYLRTTPEYLLFEVVHIAEERLVESIPVVNRMDGTQVEFTRMTLPLEFMARAHLPSKHLKALSIFSNTSDVIVIADTSDRTVNTREPKTMVIDHHGKIEVGSILKKKGNGDRIIFEAEGKTAEYPFDDKMVIGRLAATVQATPQTTEHA